MKKLLFLLLMGVLIFNVSCNDDNGDDGKMSDAAQKNLEACRQINKAIESGDVSKLDQYIAADGIDHSGMMGEVKGLDSIKAHLARLKTMSSDMKMDIIKELADDEYVFQWMRITGTAANSAMGMPAGTKFDMNAIQVSKFKDGKATDHWEFTLASEMMAMMGQGQMPMPDTSMMKGNLKPIIKEGPKVNKVDENVQKQLDKDPNKQ
jgi:predicted SnoaL-like aldol condensation-catalyzing enzyme